MRKRFATTRIGTVAAATVLALSLAGCFGNPAQPEDGAQEDTAAPVAQTALPTDRVVIPAQFFALFDVPDDVEGFLESLGCTDVVANDDGSYSVTLLNEDHTALAQVAYQGIQDRLNAATSDGTYTDVVSVSFDETFATVVVVIDAKEVPEEDRLLPERLGKAANVYQQIASLPVECDVIVVNTDDEQLFEASFPAGE